MIITFMTLALSGCSTQNAQATTLAKAGLIDLQQYQQVNLVDTH